MTIHEDLFLNLVKIYQDQGLSLDRIITDQRFKSLPLAEKVELLKEHGHIIRNGSKTDSRFWKDIGMGVAGTALVLADPIIETVSGMGKMFRYGEAAKQHHDAGEPFNEPVPKVSIKSIKDLGLRLTGAGIAVPKYYAAMTARKNMNMVKKMLKDQPGANTQEDAINVITRS